MQSVRDKLRLEILVTLALLDVLRPGDVAFDIGANVGDLSVIMSRLIGPRGALIAVEANPNTAAVAAEALRNYNCFNSYVVSRAAAATSGVQTRIWLGEGQNDSLLHQPWLSGESLPVITVTIDDLVKHFNLLPKLVKVDVEGIEFEVLRGAVSLLSTHRPIVIIEQNDDDNNCIDFLADLGYHLYCLGSYRRIRSSADYFRAGEAYIRNLLAYHPSSPHHLGTSLERLHSLRLGEVFSAGADGFAEIDRDLCTPFHELPAGRYSLQQRYRTRNVKEIEIGFTNEGGEFLASYVGPADWLEHLPDLPMHFDSPERVRLTLRCLDGGPARGRIEPSEFRLMSIEGIPAFRPSLAYSL